MRTQMKRVLVTDLDNTLWDWFGAWHSAFSSMLDLLAHQSGVPHRVLEAQIRPIHQKHGTSEYSNLIDEIPALIETTGSQKPSVAYAEVVTEMRRQRSRHTRLYPHVLETLKTLRASGIKIVAYTESIAYWTEWRIRRTGLDGLVDRLYSSPDHDPPEGLGFKRTLPDENYGLKKTQHLHLQRGVLKPNADVLLSILRDIGTAKDQALYLGDSLMKDVAMAQQAGVLDVHAKYGQVQADPRYALLQRVSHWTQGDVEREARITATAEAVSPTHVCKLSIREILPLMGLNTETCE